jgi:hypothetical protein
VVAKRSGAAAKITGKILMGSRAYGTICRSNIETGLIFISGNSDAPETDGYVPVPGIYLGIDPKRLSPKS